MLEVGSSHYQPTETSWLPMEILCSIYQWHISSDGEVTWLSFYVGGCNFGRSWMILSKSQGPGLPIVPASSVLQMSTTINFHLFTRIHFPGRTPANPVVFFVQEMWYPKAHQNPMYHGDSVGSEKVFHQILHPFGFLWNLGTFKSQWPKVDEFIFGSIVISCSISFMVYLQGFSTNKKCHVLVFLSMFFRVVPFFPTFFQHFLQVQPSRRQVWPCCAALAQHLATHPELVRRRRVFEPLVHGKMWGSNPWR